MRFIPISFDSISTSRLKNYGSSWISGKIRQIERLVIASDARSFRHSTKLRDCSAVGFGMKRLAFPLISDEPKNDNEYKKNHKVAGTMIKADRSTLG